MQTRHRLQRLRLRLAIPGILCIGFGFISSACLETTAVNEPRPDEIKLDEPRTDEIKPDEPGTAESLPDQSQADQKLADKLQANESQAGNAPGSTEVVQVKDAERVFAIALDGNAVTASVISTGCTLSEHFEVRHEVRETQCHLTLVRNKPDFCRRAPFAVDITVPLTLPAACDALPVVFDNEIAELQDKSAPPSTQRRPLGQ